MSGSFNIRRGFSLIELVIVVVIIGIIAAIAIPRMSRGAAGANDNTLAGNLAILRKAIDLYAAEHNNVFPNGTAANVALQLNSTTNIDGTVGSGAGFIFGPYIRAIPALNVGTAAQRNNTFILGTTPTVAGGWLYDAATGRVWANLATGAPNQDVAGRNYFDY